MTGPVFYCDCYLATEKSEGFIAFWIVFGLPIPPNVAGLYT